jgi:hypothetical protein
MLSLFFFSCIALLFFLSLFCIRCILELCFNWIIIFSNRTRSILRKDFSVGYGRMRMDVWTVNVAAHSDARNRRILKKVVSVGYGLNGGDKVSLP